MRSAVLTIVTCALLLITACSLPAEDEPPSSGANVTVQIGDDAITVPVTDTGIWALDYNTALNLLAMGVTPEHASRYNYPQDPFVAAAYAILQEAGVELVEPGNAELIAAAEPELIVGMAVAGNEEIIGQLDDIAPLVLLPNLPLLEDDLDTLGIVTGHQDDAATVIDRLDAKLDELMQRIASSEFTGASVSVLSACGEEAFCTYGNARGFGPILDSLGLERPPSQALEGNEWGYELISPENIDEQIAPIVIAFVGSVSFGAPSPLEHPLVDISEATTGEVDFSAWFGVGPLNYLWVLNDLDAILFDEGHVATEADGPLLWAEVTGATP